MSNLRMFEGIDASEQVPPALLPPEIKERLEAGAHLVVSVSGGKDSDTMGLVLHKLHQEREWTGDFRLVHADLGRMEWKESRGQCEALAARLNVRLDIVEHAKYDLLEGIRQRMMKRPDSPPFPSAAARYCTSDWKRGPVDKWIRNQYPVDADVIVAIGLRRDESAARAKKPECAPRPKASAPTKGRGVWTWHPILHYTLADIKAVVRDFEWKLHRAYELGNERVSCALCILANTNDLRNGARHNPELLQALIQIEDDSGFTFQSGRSLRDVAPKPKDA